MQSVLSFYETIYNQELSQAKKLHLDATMIVKRFFPSKKEEILTGELPYYPLSNKLGVELMKTLELRSNELKLTYFSFARISRFISLNKHETNRVYPLFAFDAEIELKEGNYFLKINQESRTLIKSNLPAKVSGNPQFEELLSNHSTDFHFATRLSEIIQKNTPKANASELLLYPDLWSIRKINAYLRKPFKPEDKYVPLGSLALVEKEYNSFNSLSELNQITKKNDFSDPLHVLFNYKANFSDEKRGILCEELNDSQLTAINNSNEKIVSVISGPPGTGKSFTIANLAAEKMSKGNTILIASKNREALDVIEEKIHQQLGLENLCVNPSRHESFYHMVEYLDYILGRKFTRKKYSFDTIEKAFDDFQSVHDAHLKFERELIKNFKKERNFYDELNEHRFASVTSPTFKEKIMVSRSQVTFPLWSKLGQYYIGCEYVRKQAVGTLQIVKQYMLEMGIKKYRKHLRNYQAFLRAREPQRKRSLSKNIDYKAVLTAFPVWLVKANEASKILPLEKEMFDILIVDEASQCDIPSLIPLIQRAKKLIVVGDNKQLNHISFISKAYEAACREKVEEEKKQFCKHRDYSLLDLVDDVIDPMAKTQLNEHFRSQFPIIAFSNHQFYRNNLEILTKRPVSIAKHVQFVKTNGKRTKGYHESETKAIVKKVKSILQTERHLPPHLKTTVGILSPFRKQVDFIFRSLIDALTFEEIRAHKIIVGTAFSFQGNERDLMLISFALDDNALGGSFNYLNRKDVFNVSITRARNNQIIYHSFNPDHLNEDSTTAHFFKYYQKKLQDDLGRSTKDEFCLEVAEVLVNAGLETWTNFNISGVSIDLLTKKKDAFIGIDLIGFPGEMEDYYSLERYKMIERGNIRLFPLPYPMWVGDKEKCIEAVLEIINQEVPEKGAMNLTNPQ